MAERRSTAPVIERVALYARVSTEDQADAETIQSQVEFLRRYADLHALTVAGEYLDDGVSGTIPLADRPHGARLLEDARAGLVNVVVFFRVSRLGRRLAIVLDAYEQLDAANVVIRSGTEPIDTSQPIGRFIFQMLAAFAELDRETIIDNTSRGRARGARQGRWYGVVPTGYTVADGKLVPNEREILPGLTEADLVRDIFRRVADGESSVKVAEYLTARGLGRFKRYARHDGREVVIDGAPGWPAAKVSNIIHNSTYKGLHVYEGRQGNVEREVPALVTAEVWGRAGASLSARMTRRSTIRAFYLLRSLIRCGSCGTGYVGTTRGQGVRVYRCGYAHPGTRGLVGESCRSRQIMADLIERDVWQDCERFIRNPGQTIDNAIQAEGVRRLALPDLAPSLLQVRSQLATKAGERADILTLMRRKVISIEEAEAQLGAVASEQDSLRAELARIEGQQTVQDASLMQAQAAKLLLEELRARLDVGLDDTTRRIIVHALVRRLDVYTEPGLRRRSRRRARVVAEYAFSEKKAFVIGNCSTAEEDSLSITREWVLGELDATPVQP